MSAIAQLKALLGIDTSQYKAGMADANQATHSLAVTLSQTEQKLNNTAQVARGVGQALSGNLAGGVRSIIAGLDMVPGKATIAIAKIGAVFAAFGAGWKIGGWLDKTFNISGRIAGAAVQQTEAGDQWGGWKRARKIKAETDEMRRQQMTPAERAAAEYADKRKQIQEALNMAPNETERAARREQLGVLEDGWKKRQAAEQKKEADEKQKKIRDTWLQGVKAQESRDMAYNKAAYESNDQLRQRTAEIMGAPMSFRGRDIRRDQMSLAGGSVGISRTGVGLADKQLQQMTEQTKRLQEIEKLQRETNQTLADMKAESMGL